MDAETLTSRRATTVTATVVVVAFGAYFVVATLVPNLYGKWPLYGLGALVGLAALSYAVSFVARAVTGDRPLAWRLADAVAAAISLLLVAQAASFVVGPAPLSITANAGLVAVYHLVLWTALVSTAVLLAAVFRAVGDGDLPEPV